MNGASLDQRIRLYEAADYEIEHEPRARCVGLVLAVLCVIAWAAVVGACYAAYYGAEAVFG